MSYLCWANNDAALADVDEAVEFGHRYGIYVCLNLHRAPGYCVNNKPPEPFSLWTDPAAEAAFVAEWQRFAHRYRSQPGISFNLLNEPPRPDEQTFRPADHERVMRRALAAIQEIDPDRLVILDGLTFGNEPLTEFAGLPNVAQSCRGYLPLAISHHQATWIQADLSRTPHCPAPSTTTSTGTGNDSNSTTPRGSNFWPPAPASIAASSVFSTKPRTPSASLGCATCSTSSAPAKSAGRSGT